MNSSQRYKLLLSNTVIFAVGNILVKLISFCLMPLYTSMLTTEQYGVSELLNSTIEIILPIATLCLVEALYRFSIDENVDHSVLFSSVLKIILIGDVIVLLICVAWKTIFTYEYAYYFFGLYFTTSLYKLTIQFARGLGHVKRYAFYGVLNSIILVASNIVLLVVFKGGVRAYLLSFSIGYGIAALVAFLLSREYKYISIKKCDKKVTIEMLRYSIPNIPNMLSWWVNSLSDRYIILFFCGAGITGLYTAASKLPAMINLFTSIFQQAWQYSTAVEIDKDNNQDFFEKVFKAYSFVCIMACFFVVFFNKIICKVMLQDTFYEAWKFVPMLMLAATFGCYSTFFGTFYNALKNNIMLMVSTAVGAVVNLILNFILIPYYGGFGAALATVISYVVIMIIRIIDITKKLGIRIERTALMTQIILLLVCVYLSGISGNIVSNIIELVCVCMIIILNKSLLVSIKSVLYK